MDVMTHHPEGNYFTSKYSDRAIYVKCDDLTLLELNEAIFKAATARWPGVASDKLSLSLFKENVRGCSCHPEPSDFDEFIAIYRII